ncbi:MAG: DUF3604 domain-containing protein [Holophagales bacterium]|nr:DUF3604 domain-containing protein [Holophagales bacterium]MYC08786.1 DUF3604 domain-containing protein [Holophagales bacterium]
MRLSRAALASAALFSLVLFGCAAGDPEGGASTAGGEADAPNPLKDAYFGDLHVHTRFSFDAYLFQTRTNPDDAYRFAKGEAIDHPSGHQLQLQSGALDFQAVTDHGLYLGVMPEMDNPASALYDTALGADLRQPAPVGGFARAIRGLGSGEFAELPADAVDHAARTAWQAIIDAAEAHNDPGNFTTFIGYEYTTSSDDRGNLHRNVIFKGSNVPPKPFATTDSRNPEDLWRWLDGLRDEGIEGLAIPHNSNGSNGHMFMLETVGGEPLDAAYADLRMRNEPLVEMTQVKGTSETHPLLSPNDEWAEFEIFPYRIATTLYSEPKGSYVREAYVNGLVLQETQGFNPFRFGMIGATDTHNSGGTPEEDNFHGKVGVGDGDGQRRGSVPLDEPTEDGERYAQNAFEYWGGSGLAGVWAEENTRDSIYAAFRRKETFATSGPRMRIRFFGGYHYTDDLTSDPEMIADAYDGGVPMGGDLLADEGRNPRFLVWAARDADSAPLQRLQMVKGWVEDGEPRESVIDIACADGAIPSGDPLRCPDNGASVDLSDCSYSQDLGAAELSALWTDPDFDAAKHAVYYVRVLENPTCRWSTWDAIRAGVEPNPDMPSTIQERAWSSPIWYVPGG